jgi:signal transduction histidine kinase
MNRLWLRISLSYTIVVIFAIVIPLVIGIVIRFNLGEPLFTESETQDLQSEFPGVDSEVPGLEILRSMGQFIIGVTILGIFAGMLSTRGLTAPLSRLAEAARAIGARDLTQRVKVQGSQEIKDVAQAFNEMAAELQKAETLRQNLLADVAHELRTPLAVIQGNLQAILDDVYELDKAEIAQLYDQTRQLSRLVDDLRILAQAEAKQLPLDMKEIMVEDLIKDVTTIYTSIMDSEGIEFNTQISENLPTIFGDRERLIQCLQNLINNSIRYTPKGGKICISTIKKDDSLDLIVSDTGSGISSDHLPHIFDRFYRSDMNRTRESGGTGLGLTITRAIIESHGGSISAHSDGIGKGSTFTLHIPIS